MEDQDNTDFELIKATTERAQNKKSLFNRALRKLVNSSEEELEELDDFLNKMSQIGASILRLRVGILRLMFNRQATIKALDGKCLIYNAENTFKAHIDPNFVNWNLNKAGIATPEIPVQIHEMIDDGTFMGIFGSIPGSWNQKWVSQNQVIDFCKTMFNWLRQAQWFSTLETPSQ